MLLYRVLELYINNALNITNRIMWLYFKYVSVYNQYLYPISRRFAFTAEKFMYFVETRKYIVVYVVDYSRR